MEAFVKFTESVAGLGNWSERCAIHLPGLDTESCSCTAEDRSETDLMVLQNTAKLGALGFAMYILHTDADAAQNWSLHTIECVAKQQFALMSVCLSENCEWQVAICFCFLFPTVPPEPVIHASSAIKLTKSSSPHYSTQDLCCRWTWFQIDSILNQIFKAACSHWFIQMGSGSV